MTRNGQALGQDRAVRTRTTPGPAEPASIRTDSLADKHAPAQLGDHNRSLAARAATGVVPIGDLLGLIAAAALTGRAAAASASYAAGVLIALTIGGLYRRRICLRLSDQVGRISVAAAAAAPILLVWLPATAAWQVAISAAICIVILRAFTYGLIRAAGRRGFLAQPAVIVGTDEIAILVAELLRGHTELGIRPLGYLDDGHSSSDLPLPVIGEIRDLPNVVSGLHVKQVIVCALVDRESELTHALRACRGLSCNISVVPRLADLGVAIPSASLDELWGIPLMPLRRPLPAMLWLKRVFDVVAAALLLCLCAPLLLVLAAAIRLTSGRPIMFRQTRVTGSGRVAEILKLRTLPVHSDSDTRWSVPETTGALGNSLRSTHLDELPQLVNVLRGQMSLVGPRPERPYFVSSFSGVIPGYEHRMRMRAGLTGWAQVHGLHGDTSIGDRVRFDNRYIENWSPWLDMVILTKTVMNTCTAFLRARQ
jgi:exopolysaccharide biosynthesis polyprenyl glycosylphosphotransferase